MSSGTQVDLNWAGQDGAVAPPAAAPAGPPSTKYLSDEEILGIEPAASEQRSGGNGREDQAQESTAAVARLFRGGESREAGDPAAVDSGSRDEGTFPGSKDPGYNVAVAEMPAWMVAAAAADPGHSGEAAQLWREHQEF